MKKIKQYINTMYPPSFFVLCIGLAIISLTMIGIAISLRAEILSGESDVIYRYPQMIEELLIRTFIFLPTVFIIDLNERKNKG